LQALLKSTCKEVVNTLSSIYFSILSSLIESSPLHIENYLVFSNAYSSYTDLIEKQYYTLCIKQYIEVTAMPITKIAMSTDRNNPRLFDQKLVPFTDLIPLNYPVENQEQFKQALSNSREDNDYKRLRTAITDSDPDVVRQILSQQYLVYTCAYDVNSKSEIQTLGKAQAKTGFEVLAQSPREFHRIFRNVRDDHVKSDKNLQIYQVFLAAFKQNNLQGLNFSDVNYGSALRGVDFSKANLRSANFVGCDLSRANFSGANLENANFSGLDLTTVNLKGANLAGVDFRGTDLRGVDLSGADLRGAKFQGALLGGTKFNGAQLSGTIFTGVDFRNADFRDMDFSGAVLLRANFEGAQLDGAKFIEANLQGANFSRANLLATNFRDANVREASFQSATLNSDTSFSGTQMRGAVITPEQLFQSYYPNAELPDNKRFNVFLTQEMLKNTNTAMRQLNQYSQTLKDEYTKDPKSENGLLAKRKYEAIDKLIPKLEKQWNKMYNELENKNYESANRARVEFMTLLTDKATNATFSKSRDPSWKRVISYIALSLTGIGAIVPFVDTFHSAATGHRLIFGGTTTSKQVDQIKQAITPPQKPQGPSR
jgi:uncharacterized protein YjbI with pentapeptide repeats